MPQQHLAYHRRMHPTPALDDPFLRSARDTVLRLLPSVEALYVFGSFARGTAGADSDLDLAVLESTPLAPLRRLEAQRELSVLLDRDVDLVDLGTAGSVLRSEVVNGGMALFQRDPMRILDFEARVLGEYADLLDATRALRDDVRASGRVLA
jgi:predicted nucleotidyltransferase